MRIIVVESGTEEVIRVLDVVRGDWLETIPEEELTDMLLSKSERKKYHVVVEGRHGSIDL